MIHLKLTTSGKHFHAQKLRIRDFFVAMGEFDRGRYSHVTRTIYGKIAFGPHHLIDNLNIISNNPVLNASSVAVIYHPRLPASVLVPNWVGDVRGVESRSVSGPPHGGACCSRERSNPPKGENHSSSPSQNLSRKFMPRSIYRKHT